MREHRGDLAGGDQVARGHAAAEHRREVAQVHHVDAAQTVRRVLEAAAPLRVRPGADGTAGEADAAVTQGVQVRDGLADPVGVVDHDGRQPAVQPVHEQQGDVPVEDVAAEPVELGLRHPGGAEHDPVHLRAEVTDELGLEPRVLLRVGDEEGEAERAGPRLDALGDRREERVLQVGHDEAEVAGAPRDELARGAVGPVAELASDLLHVLATGGRDEVGRAQCTRRRGGGHARGPRDVAQRHHHVASSSLFDRSMNAISSPCRSR